MKKLLLTLLGILLLPPSVSGYKVEIPSLEVDGVKIPRSVYTKILITPGTPAQEKTEPSLQVAGETPVSRSLYSKIRLDADAGTYTLVSADPATAPDLTYSFDAAPQVSVTDHTYITPAVSGSYTLVSNNHDKYDDLAYNFDEHPQVYLTTEIKDYITSVESIGTDGQPLMTYHSATQTLRATLPGRREVQVINLSGQIMLAGRLGGDDGMLSVATLPAGVYVVIARRNGAEAPQVLKFIKQ